MIFPMNESTACQPGTLSKRVERETEGQTDRQTERHTETETDKQKLRKTFELWVNKNKDFSQKAWGQMSPLKISHGKTDGHGSLC